MIKYHHIEVKIESTDRPTYFMGSALRGAFGYALKRVVCINPSFKCEECFAKGECLFYEFFEEKNSFHKYRFDIELGSDKFDFGLYIFNSACNDLLYILSSLEKLLREIGVGADRYKFNNFSIYLNGKEIYNSDGFQKIDSSPKTFQNQDYFRDIKLEILTPIRIKRDNRLLKKSLELEDILTSIYKREEKLFFNRDIYKLNYTPSYTTTLKRLQYKPLLRRSNRQDRKLKVDGIIGEMAILNIDKRSFELLKLGEIIGVGKQSVFGLGKIRVKNLKG